jgi:hypothetical protein
LWGLAGGATDDYYITKGIPYSFTLGEFILEKQLKSPAYNFFTTCLELPGDDKGGSHGFLLPPNNIKKVKYLLNGTVSRDF